MTEYANLDEMQVTARMVATEYSDEGRAMFTVEPLGATEPGEKPVFGFTHNFIKDYGMVYGDQIKIGVSRFKSLGFCPRRRVYLGVLET